MSNAWFGGRGQRGNTAPTRGSRGGPRGGRGPRGGGGGGGGGGSGGDVREVCPRQGPSSESRELFPRDPNRRTQAAGDNEARRPSREPNAGRDPAAGDRNRPSRRVIQDEIKTRPRELQSKKGSSGNIISLKANYFNLNQKTDWSLYQYRVDISPEEDRTFVRKAYVRKHEAVLGFYLCDGTTLFTSQKYRNDPYELSSIGEDGKPRLITLRFVGDLNQGDAHIIQFFNIIVRKCLENMNLELIGRNYWDRQARLRIPNYNFEIWPGYVTSIRQLESGIMMCTDISHKIMRTDTAHDNLREIMQRVPNNWQNEFKRMIIGCTVITHYNNKTYLIDDVDFSRNPLVTFDKDGRSVTLQEYYRERYQIRINDNRQPLLVSRTTARQRRSGMQDLLYLIPELCYITGMTDDMRSNFKLMSLLASHTRVGPAQRVNRFMAFKRRLTDNPRVVEDFRKWNLSLSQDLVEFQGRTLKGDKILFGNRKEVDVVKNNKADWNFDQQKMPVYLQKVAPVIKVVVPRRLAAETRAFIGVMNRAAVAMNIRLGQGSILEMQDNPRPEDYTNAFEQIMRKESPSLIMVIVQNNQLLRYAAIKKKLCIDRPVPSQVVMAKNLSHQTPSKANAIAGKIIAQINCKLGGMPWTMVNLPPGLMVVGFDVCHEKGKKSWGAMVAALELTSGKFFSAVSSHEPGEELSSFLATQIIAACDKYKQFYGKLPQKIAIYRDGVGEGQLNFVHDFEVDQIKKGLDRLYAGTEKYRLLFTIVTKRLSTRIVTKNHENPPPGTVVDDVITNPLQYDFFIISQNVNQGTVTPTAYNVIEDNFGWVPDKVQKLTYMLCNLYFNFSGAIRVPAPCQYAHKLAYFVSTTLQSTAHKSLQDSCTLYFL